MECLACGSKKVSKADVLYFPIPLMKIVPASYVLCEEHKNVRYVFGDIYDLDGNRFEKIDHESVISRSLKKEK